MMAVVVDGIGFRDVSCHDAGLRGEVLAVLQSGLQTADFELGISHQSILKANGLQLLRRLGASVV